MPRGNRYQVKPSESLLQIAQGNNLTYQDLLKANPGVNRVSTGQVINLPTSPLDIPTNRAGLYDVPTPEQAISPFAQGLRSVAGLFVGGKQNLPTPVPPGQPLSARETFSGFGQNFNTVTGQGSGQDLYRPTTTARINPADFKDSPNRLNALVDQLKAGANPAQVNPYDAQALGMTSQDLVRAGYRFDSATATFVFTGSENVDTAAEGQTSSGSGGGGLRPGTLGAAVQYYTSIGKNKKAHEIQQYENYLNRVKSGVEKQKRDRRRRRMKQRRAEQLDRENQSGTVQGYGLVDFNYRVSTG